MSRLQATVYDRPDGAFLAAWIPRAMTLTTNVHGDESAQLVIVAGHALRWQWYEVLLGAWVKVDAGGESIWEGRIEDLRVTGIGLEVVALGGWTLLSDIPSTALWSTTNVRDFRIATPDDEATRVDKKFQFDNKDRLFVSLTKNTAYVIGDNGEWKLDVPSGNGRKITHVSWDYAMLLPADFRIRLVSYDAGYASGTSESSVTGTGALVTGSQAVTLATPRDFVTFNMRCYTAGTHAAENGANYVKFTNIRVRTVATVDSDTIAVALLTDTRAVNSQHLRDSTALIQNTGQDFRDERYTDALPSEVLTRLAAVGNGSTPWAVGVEDRRLYLRPYTSAGRAWYVNASRYEMQRSLEQLVNSAYSVYSVNSVETRGAVATDATSVSTYRVTRRRHVSAESSTSATATRDRAISEGKTPQPRPEITFDKVYTAAGVRVPLWLVRAGDTITIRNIPPTLGTAVDQVRTFRLGHTEYEAHSDTLRVPFDRLEALLVRAT